MSEVSGAIRAALAEAATIQGQPTHFGTPLHVLSGPLSGHSITVFRGGRDPEVQELLVRRHEAYLDCLHLAGVRVPDTKIRILDDAGTLRPVILQQRVADNMLLVPLLQQAGTEAAIGLLDQVATNVAEFWRRVAQRPERVGLQTHPAMFAMDENGPVLLDTFPPLIAYDRYEMGKLIQRFADSGLIRSLGKVLPGRVRDLQDRWYTPAATISTLIDGALHLRPDDAAAILDWAEGFSASRLEGPWHSALQAHLQRQSRAKGLSPRRWPVFGGRDRPHA